MTGGDVASTTRAERTQATAGNASHVATRRHRDLFEPRSVLGALGVVAVLCVFGFGLRAIDENQKTSGFDVGSAYEVSKTVSFTPVTGWSIDKSATVPGAVVTLIDNGVTTKVLSLTLPPNQTAEGFAKIFRDGDTKNDAYTDVTGFKTFVTTGGAHGVTWSATGPITASQNWIVASPGKEISQMRTEGPASNWSAIQPDLDAMARSITFTAANGGASQ
jgi:hypothetical protein